MLDPVLCPESIAVNQDFCLYGDHILHGMKAHDKQMTKYVAILAVISVPQNLSMVMMIGMWGFSESVLRIGKTCCLRGHSRAEM